MDRRLPYRRLLAAGLFLTVRCAPAWAAPGPPAPTVQAPAAPLDPQIVALDALLLHAPDADHADAIAARLETIRAARLSPTVTLLLRRAQREAAASRLHEAADDIDDAVELQPDQALPWREHATIDAGRGDPDGAIAHLGAALSRDPTDILSWTALSEIEEHRSQPRLAFEAWERVLALDPMIAGGARRLAHLHRLMVGDPT